MLEGLDNGEETNEGAVTDAALDGSTYLQVLASRNTRLPLPGVRPLVKITNSIKGQALQTWEEKQRCYVS